MEGAPSEIENLANRLQEVAGELRAADLAAERAEKLAREAADLAARAGAEVERALREASEDR